MSAGFTVSRAKITGPRRTKYNATPTIVDNIRFPSKKEARRYATLKMEQQAGKIKDLVLQPAFTLYAPKIHGEGNVRVGVYKADFAYIRNGKKIIEDVKGHKTDVYKLKKKIVEASYGITIVES